MKNEILLLLLVLVPIVGSFLLPFLGLISEKIRNILAALFVFVSLVASALLLPSVLAGKTVAISFPSFPHLVLWQADMLSVFMALVSSLVGFIIVVYSIDYISHYEFRNEYYFMVVLFLGSMMGLVFARNLIVLYVFWEITAIASWRLIGFFREKTYVLRADKAFLVTFFGAVLMLLGFIFLYDQFGSFDLAILKEKMQGNPIANTALVLILCGILSKSATLPFHTWLPDAGVAPSPVTALLHAAVLVKIGVYVFARLFVATFTVDPVWYTILPIVAAVSALVSACAALLDTDLKRIIAYSTVSQIGFIFLGLSVGNEIGIAGGLLYILMHGLSKGGLFLCAGIVEQNTHTKDITQMGGLFRTMPVTAISFLLCAFSVMGIPPFGGFFSKYMVISGAVMSHSPWIAAVFIVGAILTVIYLLRVFMMVFLGEAQKPAPEHSSLMVGSVATLALLSLLGGLLIQYPSAFALSAVKQMLEMIK